MKSISSKVESESAQMLLATGLVLLMSLLSMSVYGVQMAGLGDPYDPGSDSVIETQKEVVRCFQPSLENRTNLLVNAGMSWEEAVQGQIDDHTRKQVKMTDGTLSPAIREATEKEVEEYKRQGKKILPQQKYL